MSRNIDMMHPSLKVKYIAFTHRMNAAGLSFVVTCVERTILEQMALYVQGRLSVDDVNMYRMVAGMDRIKEGSNRKVTWTLNSRHIVNFYDADITNDYSLAFDFALMKYDRPHWDIKLSINDNEIPDYIEAGHIARECGLTSGAFWKNPDYCHCQIDKPKASGIPNATPA